MKANVYGIDGGELVALTVDELRDYGAAKWVSGNNDGCEDDGSEDEVELRVVVRCRDCVHAVLGFADGEASRSTIGCDWFDRPHRRNVIEVEPDGFCAWGRHVTPAAQ